MQVFASMKRLRQCQFSQFASMVIGVTLMLKPPVVDLHRVHNVSLVSPWRGLGSLWGRNFARHVS
jgi:hypothetical protein